MFKNHLKKTVIITALFTLIGCSSVPTDININPELNLALGQHSFNSELTWQVNSQDLRVARHLVQIGDDDEAAQLINEQQSLRLLLQKNLTNAWLGNKLKITPQSDYKIDIKLMKALATATEAVLTYEVKSQLIIKIQLTHQGKKFVKLFRSNNQWKAPFSTDVTRITEELNTQLSELLSQIVQDEEMNARLQQF